DPVLEDFDLDLVVCRPGIFGPKLAHVESYPIEDPFGAIDAAVGFFLGVYEGGEDALDDTGLSPAVVRCADVARRVVLANADMLASGKLRGHGPPPASVPPPSCRPAPPT